jgi:HAE1 family hydrophobic/amphiphilic exporter-1
VESFGRRFVSPVVEVNRFLQRSLWLRIATVFGLVMAAFVGVWVLMPQVEYLPAGNRNLAIGILLPPPGYNIDRSLELGSQLENATRPYWDVDIENPPPDLVYPMIEDHFFVAATRSVFMGLRGVDGRELERLVGLIQREAMQIPGTIARAFRQPLFSSELGAGRTVDIEITGPDLDRLVALSRGVFGSLSPDGSGFVSQVVPGAFAFPLPSLDLNAPEVHVSRKSEQSTDLGVTTDELGYTVDALIDGAYATDYYLQGDKIDLTIIGNENYAGRTQDLKALVVATPSNDLVRLETLANVELAGGPEQINRRERQRAITISVSPPPSVPLEQAMGAIQREIIEPRLASGEIGGEYRIALAGTADKLVDTWQALRWNILLALLVTYLLMAALFESWLYPFVIILSVPLGAVGGFLGLQLVNFYLALWPYGEVQTLDVLTMLGFVILIGTVVNNPILIVHQSLNYMRRGGMAPNDAILESVRTRIRPIFMTTSTTVLGLSPLVLFPGAGAELYRGLGAVVLGGLIVSTIFTLVLVPTLFSLMMDAKTAVFRLTGGFVSDSRRDTLELEPGLLERPAKEAEEAPELYYDSHPN